jgi:uncharacterized membrane protein YfcA
MLFLGLCLYAMFTAPLAAEGPWLPQSSAPPIVGITLGFAIGCYGTIVGIGGGPIIMPILFAVYRWDSEHLVATCLFIVFLNALSGSIGYARQGRIDYLGGAKFSLAAIPGAVVLSVFHHAFDISWFNTAFGVFLISLAVYSVLNATQLNIGDAAVRRPPTRGARHLRIIDSSGKKFEFFSDDTLGIKLNLALGAVSGFLGIGGGVLQVPILLYLLRYPPHIATATSHFITMLTCAAALFPHIYLGNIQFSGASWMAVGVIGGAQIGAKLARDISARATVYLFVVILLVFATRLLLA